MIASIPSGPSAKALVQASLSDEERITIVRSGTWILAGAAVDIVGTMDKLLAYPRVGRPPCFIFVGDPNSGKSTILTRFMSRHAPDLDPASEVTTASVVRIESPSGNNFAAIFSRLLDSVNATYKPTAKPEVHLSQLLKLFRKLQVKMILMDEFHNALGGSMKQQNDYRVALKTLTNSLQANIVVTGVHSALTFFSQDLQFTSRFKPGELSSWSPGQEMGIFLATLESRLPLSQASKLASEEMMLLIDSRAKGNLGDIVSLVQEAAIAAIKDKSKPERITSESLKNVLWSPSSDRRAFTDSLKQERTRSTVASGSDVSKG